MPPDIQRQAALMMRAVNSRNSMLEIMQGTVCGIAYSIACRVLRHSAALSQRGRH
jgi:hypothetical protein